MLPVVAGQDLETERDQKTSFDFAYDLYPGLHSVDLDAKALEFCTTFAVPKGVVGVGGAYTYTAMTSSANAWTPELMAYGDFHRINLLMTYTHALSDSWSFDIGFSPQLSSTFATSLRRNALVLGSQIGVKRLLGATSKPSYLSIGLAYGTALGSPKLYPTLSYFNTINAKLRYKLGFPETAVYYTLNTQSRFDFTIAPQSLYTVHHGSLYTTSTTASVSDTYLEYTALQWSLRYHFDFDNHWSSFFKVGYSTSTAMTINTINTDTTVYDFEADNGFMVGFGLNFNINNNK